MDWKDASLRALLLAETVLVGVYVWDMVQLVRGIDALHTERDVIVYVPSGERVVDYDDEQEGQPKQAPSFVPPVPQERTLEQWRRFVTNCLREARWM